MTIPNVPLYGDEYRKLFGNLATLSPTAQDEPNLTVKISAGGFWSFLDGVAAYVEYVGGSSPTISVPASNARWVVVTLNQSGMVVNIDGDIAASPVLPTIPRNRYPIALVYVATGTTKITNDMVFDARPIFANPVRSHLDLMDLTEAGCHSTAAITGLDALLATFPTTTDLASGLLTKADTGGTTAVTFKLNKDHTGAPASDCAFEVERGASTNVAVMWDEAAEVWKYTNDGATWYTLSGAYYNDGSQALKLKQTVAATTPPVLTDGQSQIWVNSDDNKVYLIFKPTGLTQVKVELT